MCTRVVYLGDGSRVLTARTMDWAADVGTNLWAFPRGMSRHGAAGTGSLTWVSRFGSVVATGYDVSTTDGMNDVGLVANALWLVESTYPPLDDPRPKLSIGAWAQYVLDNFGSVAEAVEELSQERFTVLTTGVPGQPRDATMHLAISDPTGDSAIFEYLDGRLVIHHDRSYQVMTNSPPFIEQLVINAYWHDIGGTVMLPGTNRASDRYVRASFYINAVPQVEDRTVATAAVFGVIRNASVPYGISTPGQPNISSTRWRTVADHKDLRYYFDSVLWPSVIWVELDRLDLGTSGPARRLELVNGGLRDLGGDVTSLFEATDPSSSSALRPHPSESHGNLSPKCRRNHVHESLARKSRRRASSSRTPVILANEIRLLPPKTSRDPDHRPTQHAARARSHQQRPRAHI